MELIDISNTYPDYTDGFNDALRFIARFRWTNTDFKVGRTSSSNLKGRLNWYFRNTDYNYMTLLFQTSSKNRAGKIEIEIQKHFKDISDNLRDGGGGWGRPPYYMYIVTIEYPPFLY